MPRSKDVDAYADTMFKIAALMRTNKDFHTEWMDITLAKRMRYTWLAFVRAHYATIDRTNASVSSLRLTSKDPLASERITPARNLLLLNRAREARLDVIKKFECALEIDATDLTRKARLHFREKSLPLAPAGIDALFDALPASQKRYEEQMQMEMEAAAQAPAPAQAQAPPDLSEFLFMPIEDKIRSGIATEEDFKSSSLDPRTLRELVLAVEDNDTRNRMLSLLPPVPSPRAYIPLTLGEPEAQLDSAAAPRHDAQATTANAVDDFSTTKGNFSTTKG